MSTITLKNVQKRYSFNSPLIIDDLNLEIEEGDFLCLLGPSGCGKTTTLRMIAGLEHLTQGEILINGQPVDSTTKGAYVPPEKRGMGFVFQSYALWPHLSVFDNIDFGLKLKKLGQKEREKIASSVMDKLGILALKDRYPGELSGGQQQRVALARMMATRPKIVLMDEPLSNLDAQLRLEMRSELRKLHEESGSTFVFVTHDQWEAMTLANKIAVMDGGKLQQIGTPEEIYDSPANRFVANFIGNPPMNFVELSNQDNPFIKSLKAYIADNKIERAESITTVGIRPESIQIHPKNAIDSSKNSFIYPTKILAVLPTGGSWIIELLIEGLKIFSVRIEVNELESGQEVDIRVDENRLHFFDEEGKRV